MESLKVLILISFLKFSVQFQCTKQETFITKPAYLNKIIWEVIRESSGETLGDYKGIQNGTQALSDDLECYNRGLDNSDANLTITEMVAKYGYTLEEHNVTTDDGYKLTLHRIPGKGRPVFIQHGIFGSSIDWFMSGNNSLPYMLSAKGYDVWLGNARGNQYSRLHENLTTDCAEFWDYSFDEIGNFDLPASIDYVVEETGEATMTYIGYSSGTTALFVMASMKPHYNEKLPTIIGIAPMAWMCNSKSPILNTLTATPDLEAITKPYIGPYEFSPKPELTSLLSKSICAPNTLAQILCQNFAFMVTGFDSNLLNLDEVYAINQHFPSGGSTKELYHFAQGITFGQFRRYDHDSRTNIDKYGFINPPGYTVSNIKSKVSLIYSNNDWLSNTTDVNTLISNLPNLGDLVEIPGLDHLSFIWGKDSKELVFDKVVEFVDKQYVY